MKTIASLLAGMSIVMIERHAGETRGDPANILRIYFETDAEDHLSSTIDIPEETLPDYEEDIRKLFYRQDPPFDPKADISTGALDEPVEIDDDEENRIQTN